MYSTRKNLQKHIYRLFLPFSLFVIFNSNYNWQIDLKGTIYIYLYSYRVFYKYQPKLIFVKQTILVFWAFRNHSGWELKLNRSSYLNFWLKITKSSRLWIKYENNLLKITKWQNSFSHKISIFKVVICIIFTVYRVITFYWYIISLLLRKSLYFIAFFI